MRVRILGLRFLLLLFLGHLSLACSGGETVHEKALMEDAMEKGNHIVSAIENYRKEFECYPNVLTDLVDKGLLNEVEQPQWGSGKWQYDRVPLSTGDGFCLYVREGTENYPVLLTYGKRWKYVDGGF